MTDGVEKNEFDEGKFSADLVERIRRGEESAKQAMCRHYYPGLRVLLRRRTGETDRAEDLCQETFARALQALSSATPKDPAKLGGFLWGIANNVYREWVRAEVRHATTPDTELIERIGDESRSPFAGVSREEIRKAMRGAIDSLRMGRDRQIAYRHFLYGEDKASLCDEFGVTAAKFNDLTFRVKERLKRNLWPGAEQDAKSLTG